MLISSRKHIGSPRIPSEYFNDSYSVACWPLRDSGMEVIGGNHMLLTNAKFSEGSCYFNGSNAHGISTRTIDMTITNKMAVYADIAIHTYELTGTAKIYVFGTANACAVNMQGGAVGDPFELLTLGNVGLNQSYYLPGTIGVLDKNFHSFAFLHDMSKAVNENSMLIDGTLKIPSSYPAANNNTGAFGNNTLYVSRRSADATQLSNISIKNILIRSTIDSPETIADYTAWMNDSRNPHFFSMFGTRSGSNVHKIRRSM